LLLQELVTTNHGTRRCKRCVPPRLAVSSADAAQPAGSERALGDEVEVRYCREVPGDEGAALPLAAVFLASFAAITAG